MGNSTTLLDTISQSQAQKEVSANALFDAASVAMVYGRRASTTVALTWGYYGGVFTVAGTPTSIANGTVSLTASSTNYVYVDASGAVFATTTAPTNWPGPIYGAGSPTQADGSAALYEVVTGTATVTSWTDLRALGGIGVATGQGPTGPSGPTGPAASPGGSTTEIQFNNAAVFDGDSRLTFNATTKIVTGQFAIDSNAINAQAGTSYVLQATDNGKVVTLDNGSAISLLIPSGLGAGFSCLLIQLGAGTVTVSAQGGSPQPTVNSRGSVFDIAGQDGAASVVAYAADVFNLSGDLA